jgi:hypothetical protein
VEELVLVVARASPVGAQLELAALRVEAVDGPIAASREATVAPDELPGFLDAFAGEASRRGGPAGGRVAEGPGLPLASPLLWGTGAAALVTGAVFGVLAADRAAGWRATPQPMVTASAQLRSQGQTFAVVADVSLLVALAAVVTGSVVAIAPRSPPMPGSAPADR